MCLTLGFRKHYRNTRIECRSLDKLTRQETKSVQENKLGDWLQYAVNDCPFYRPYRQVVEKYKACDALQEFPILTKEDVQENWEELRPSSLRPIPHHVCTTGGSSGNQLDKADIT